MAFYHCKDFGVLTSVTFFKNEPSDFSILNCKLVIRWLNYRNLQKIYDFDENVTFFSER